MWPICFVFNRHVYTFPSHWTWLTGRLEFVNTQLLPLGRRPAGDPCLWTACTVSDSHPVTRTHTHVLVGSHPWLCPGQYQQGHTLPSVYGCVPADPPRAPQGHNMRSPKIPCNHVCMFMCIGVLAHNSTHASFEPTNPLSFRYERGCELPVVYTDTHTHLTGVCAQSHTQSPIWVHTLFSGKFYIKALTDRYTHNYTNPPARISKAKCSTTCTTNINTKVANSYTHT